MREAVERPGSRPSAPPALDLRHLIVTGSDGHPSRANGMHNAARQMAREQIAAGQQPNHLLVRWRRRSVRPRGCGADGCSTGCRRVPGRAHRAAPAQDLEDADGGGGATNSVSYPWGPRPATGGHRIPPPPAGHSLRSYGARPIFARLRHNGPLPASADCALPDCNGAVVLCKAHFVQALSSTNRRVLRRIAPRARIEPSEMVPIQAGSVVCRSPHRARVRFRCSRISYIAAATLSGTRGSTCCLRAFAEYNIMAAGAD